MSRSVATKTGVSAEVIRRIGQSAAAAKSAVALPPGVGLTSRRATASIAAVLILNQVLGAIGHGTFRSPRPRRRPASPAKGFRDVVKLIAAMKSGDVSVAARPRQQPGVLAARGCGLQRGARQGRLRGVVRFDPGRDQREGRPDPARQHSRSNRGATRRPTAGVRSIVQPTLRPIYDTQSLGDTLLQTARAMGGDVAGKLPEGSFRDGARVGLVRRRLARSPRRGVATSRTHPSRPSQLSAGRREHRSSRARTRGQPATSRCSPIPRRCSADGSGAELPWLQETPDPVSESLLAVVGRDQPQHCREARRRHRRRAPR